MVRSGKNGGLHLKQIAYYKRTGEYHASTLPSERSGIRRAEKKFLLKEKKLYYVGKESTQMRLAIITEEEKKKVLRECHENTTGIHHGISRTLTLVETSYYWTSVTSDVKQWVHDCQHCQTRNANLITTTLHPNKLDEPWNTTRIELLGPFNATSRKHMYTSLITDLFTNWIAIFPLCEISAAEIAKRIVGMFFLYGPPQKMMLHQENEFVHQINREIFRLFGLKQFVIVCTSKPDDPHEETSKIIKGFLSNFCMTHPSDWDEDLSAIAYAFNSLNMASEKRTPHFQMFHRNIHVPETSSAVPVAEGQSICRFAEILEAVKQADRLDVRNADCQIVKSIPDLQLKRSEVSLKTRMKPCNPFCLKVGHEVLRQRKNWWKDGRFQSEWIGPCVIDYITDNGCAVLRDNAGTRLKRPIKMSHLKPFTRWNVEQDSCRLSQGSLVFDHDYIGLCESSTSTHQQNIMEEEAVGDHAENTRLSVTHQDHEPSVGDTISEFVVEDHSIQSVDSNVEIWSQACLTLQNRTDGTYS